jgi:Variant SH3 domain
VPVPPIAAKKPIRAILATAGSSQDLDAILPISGQSSEAISQQAEKLKALYDFEAANELEISVKVGDVLYLVMARDDGWTQCQTENGNEGLVPSAYVVKE